MLPGRRTANGALYVLQGPAPAGSVMMGGIALSPAGAIYISQSFTPPFTPLSLFASGEQGAWYDPSDLSTMFQDRAGTTPVTADGQTVGKILDKSGNDNHAVAPSDASRPLYKTDGTYHWLQFDGVDDGLNTGNIDFTSTSQMSLFHGVNKIDNTTRVVCELSLNGANSGCFYSVTGADSGFATYSSMSTGSNPASSNKAAGTSDGLVTEKAVLSYTHNIPGDLSTCRRNAIAGTSGTGVKGTGNYTNEPIYIGRRGGGTLFFNGNIYSIIVCGALSTTQEITDTETWVNSKTGAY